MVSITRQLFIEITSREVRFLLYNKNNLSFHSIPYEFKTQNMSGLVEILKDYRQKYFKGAKVPVYLLIPFQNGLLREFILPWMDVRKRSSAISYYLKHEIPGLTSELIYTYHVIEEPNNKKLTVKVFVARKDLIDFYIKNMEEAGYLVRGIEYSISALSELFSYYPSQKVLYLQSTKDRRIQMVLYREAEPEVVTEITFEQLDVTKYQIYLGLNEYDIPVDFVVTDLSEQTNKLASLLLEAGLVKDRLVNFNKKIIDTKIELEQGSTTFPTYPLLAEFYRVKENRNLNFFPEFQRVNKAKALILSAVCVLATFLLLANAIWYPKYDDLKKLEQELAYLQDYHAYLQNDEIVIALSEWQAQQKSKILILEKVLYALKDMEKEISLSRLSFNNNTMYIWAECYNEMAISNTMEKLGNNGWKNPVLIDYYFDNQKLVFCLSVEGSW